MCLLPILGSLLTVDGNWNSMFFFYKSPKEALAQCVLAEVPQQVVNYFSTYKLQPPRNPAAKWMGWAGQPRLRACFPCLSTDFGSWDASVYMYAHTTVWSCLLAFCLQNTLPSVPFKGHNCYCVDIWCPFERRCLHGCILFWRGGKKRGWICREKRGNSWKGSSCLFDEYGQWECSVTFVGINTRDCGFSVIIKWARNEKEGVSPPSR